MTYRHRTANWMPVALAVAAMAAGCKDETKRRVPPPPPKKAATCDGPRRVNDPANLKLLPDKTGAFCIDPTGSDKGYGEGTKNPIGGICDLFDGECDIYTGHGAQRVIEARYVDGSGSGATIDVYLSKFDKVGSAYAMFTMRVVGDGDPAHPDTAKPIKGGGAAALGSGNAYLWRGHHLAEVTYNDTAAVSLEQVKAKSDKLLPPLVAAIGDKLPGDTKLPAAAAALPTEMRLPMGIRYLPKKLLGIEGTGNGAFGYYRDGDKRWRVLSIVKEDVDQAKDVIKTVSRVDGAAREKDIGDAAARLMLAAPGGPKTEWLVARKDMRVFGIGDEDRVLRDGMSAVEHRAKTLSQDEKREKLKQLVK